MSTGTIPLSIKVQGRTLMVNASGRGYVTIGGHCADARDQFDSPEDWERFKTTCTEKEWRGVMYRCFEQARAACRKDRKNKP